MAREDTDAYVEALRKQIGQEKEYFSRIIVDRDEWKSQREKVSQLLEEMNKEKPGSESREEKREELEGCRKELERISSECFDKYHAMTVMKLSSEIANRSMNIKSLEDKLQIIEGKRKCLEGQGGQSQQNQEGRPQQRVKVVAEPQIEFTGDQEKRYEPERPPDDRWQTKYTVSRHTSFKEEREALNKIFESKNKDKQKEQQEKSHGRGGRDM